MSSNERFSMTQQDKHLETSRAIDEYLLQDEFKQVAVDDRNRYEDWYAILLSTIVLLIADEEVRYAYVDYEPSMPDIRISVFTTNLVVFAEVDVNADGVPVARVVPRRSLLHMKLSSSGRIDARERQAFDWPGTLNLQLRYPELPKIIEVVVSGVNRYAVREPSAIVGLIEGLSADLAAPH
jgi:hypothetical protein